MLEKNTLVNKAAMDGSNKVKRTRTEHVKQTVNAYLQKRNIPAPVFSAITLEEQYLNDCVESEVARPNSIIYSCSNNDPAAIDVSFSNFLHWLKEPSNRSNFDLCQLLAPLFCHLYLEILRGGHREFATEFFKRHIGSVDQHRSEGAGTVAKLIHLLSKESAESASFKDIFRGNKYVVQLKSDSVQQLLKFLRQSHVVLLHVLSNWFVIEEDGDEESDEAMVQHPDEHSALCNGHANSQGEIKPAFQKLQDAINGIKDQPDPILSVHLSNVMEDVTCGILNQLKGLIAYSYNNAILLRSIVPLKQLGNANEMGEIVFKQHCGRVYDMCYINNYNCLLSASQDNTLCLFDLSDFTLRTIYKGHNYPVYCVDACATGDYIVSGSYDRCLRLWPVSQERCVRLYAGHMQEITSVNFHPNCAYIASGMYNSK